MQVSSDEEVSRGLTIAEHSAEVSDDVDDAKDQATLGEHGQVAATLVARHWACLRLDQQVLKDLFQNAKVNFVELVCEGVRSSKGGQVQRIPILRNRTYLLYVMGHSPNAF